MLFVSVLFCLLVFKVGLQVQLEEVVVRGGSELLWQLVPDCCVQWCEVLLLLLLLLLLLSGCGLARV